MLKVGFFFIYTSHNLKSTQENILFRNFFIAPKQNHNSISSRANLLMEFDLLRTAIKKLDDTLPQYIDDNNILHPTTRNIIRCT